jgi:hypothetical protein
LIKNTTVILGTKRGGPAAFSLKRALLRVTYNFRHGIVAETKGPINWVRYPPATVAAALRIRLSCIFVIIITFIFIVRGLKWALGIRATARGEYSCHTRPLADSKALNVLVSINIETSVFTDNVSSTNS